MNKFSDLAIEDCLTVEQLIGFFHSRGYKNVWIEDTDEGLIIKGLSTGYGEGGLLGPEYIVPENWTNR